MSCVSCEHSVGPKLGCVRVLIRCGRLRESIVYNKFYKGIGYKNILVNLDDAPKVERTYRSGDLHHERAQRATYSSETLENGSG